MLSLTAGTAAAQSAQVQGVINGRSGPTMTVQEQAGNVVVVLNSMTQVEDVSGVFHARKKQMGVTAWCPAFGAGARDLQRPEPVGGRHRQVQQQELQTASDIQAGVAPVEQQTQQQQQELAQQQAKLQQQQAQIKATEEEQAKHDAGNRRQEGGRCRRQQALWRAGRVQHLGRSRRCCSPTARSPSTRSTRQVAGAVPEGPDR